jgi:AcrR family transcriptional regulator
MTELAAKNNGKTQTGDQILNSSKRLFADKIYQKTTVVDISKQADLSESTLYEYFQRKENLL